MDSTKRIKLIAEESFRGSYGQEVITETATEVYGMLRPITREEWNSAGQRGIEASFRLDVYTFEYSGELIVEVDGERYEVYRQYVNIGNDRTELYCQTALGVTYAEEEVEDEDLPKYVEVYEMLSSSGIPVFYGNAPRGQKLPYITYTMVSSNFAADDKVYSQGYELTVSLYTGRKDLKRERALEQAFDNNDVFWERDEANDMDERVYIQTYEAEIR